MSSAKKSGPGIKASENREKSDSGLFARSESARSGPCRPEIAKGKNNGRYNEEKSEITRGKTPRRKSGFLLWGRRGRNNYPVQIFVGAYERKEGERGASLFAPLPLSNALLPFPLPSPFSLPANWLGQDLHKNNLEQQSLEQLPPYLAGHRSPPRHADGVLF